MAWFAGFPRNTGPNRLNNGLDQPFEPIPQFVQPVIRIMSVDPPGTFANVTAGVLDAIVAFYIDRVEFKTFFQTSLTYTAFLIYDAAAPGSLQTFELPQFIPVGFSPFFQPGGQLYSNYTVPPNLSVFATNFITNGGFGVQFNWDLPAAATPGPQVTQLPLSNLTWITPK